jgi:hypothetical protein
LAQSNHPSSQTPVEKRHFEDWAMGFRNLKDESVPTMPGFSEFLNLPMNPSFMRKNPNQVVRLLDVFCNSFSL